MLSDNKPLKHKVTYKSLEPAMRKNREKIFPKRPSSPDEMVTMLDAGIPFFDNNYKGAVKSEGKTIGVAFSNKNLLNALKDKEDMAFDATYFVVPLLFYQLFTVHFIHKGQFFPAICILMTGKTENCYKAVFAKIKELCPAWKPKNGIADFEIASRKQAMATFIGLLVRGCYFHYSQAIFKNLQKLGFAKHYITNPQFRKWAKRVMSVALLPATLIRAKFEDLLSQTIMFASASDRKNFSRFKGYVRKQWLNIPVDVLSVHSLEHATNNGSESFHSKLKAIIKSHQPSIWMFVYHINNILTDYDTMYDQLEEHGAGQVVQGRRSKTVKNIQNRRDAETELAAGTIDVDQFLDRVSYNNETLVSRLQNDFANNETVLDNDPDVINHDEIEVEQPTQPQNAPNISFDCNVCYANLGNARICIIPCGHAKTCQVCIDRIKVMPQNNVCPECRGPITNTLTIFT